MFLRKQFVYFYLNLYKNKNSDRLFSDSHRFATHTPGCLFLILPSSHLTNREEHLNCAYPVGIIVPILS